MEAAVFYFSYNDLNNLIGRVANQFGLKFGHHGLVYVNRGQSGNTLNKVTLTKNPAKMYEFLGYDYERYLQGFDTIDDVFNFVLSGNFFSKEIFAYENLNHQNRTRNRKRRTYQLFLEFIDDKDVYYEFNPEEEYLDHINDFFPEVALKQKLEEFKSEESYRKILKDKFSGKVVMEVVPEIKEVTLGNFITYFKSKYSNFETYLMESSEDRIKMDIRFHYNIFKSSVV